MWLFNVQLQRRLPWPVLCFARRRTINSHSRRRRHHQHHMDTCNPRSKKSRPLGSGESSAAGHIKNSARRRRIFCRVLAPLSILVPLSDRQVHHSRGSSGSRVPEGCHSWQVPGIRAGGAGTWGRGGGDQGSPSPPGPLVPVPSSAGNIGARRLLTSTRGLLTSTGTGSCTCFSWVAARTHVYYSSAVRVAGPGDDSSRCLRVQAMHADLACRAAALGVEEVDRGLKCGL